MKKVVRMKGGRFGKNEGMGAGSQIVGVSNRGRQGLVEDMVRIGKDGGEEGFVQSRGKSCKGGEGLAPSQPPPMGSVKNRLDAVPVCNGSETNPCR